MSEYDIKESESQIQRTNLWLPEGEGVALQWGGHVGGTNY